MNHCESTHRALEGELNNEYRVFQLPRCQEVSDLDELCQDKGLNMLSIVDHLASQQPDTSVDFNQWIKFAIARWVKHARYSYMVTEFAHNARQLADLADRLESDLDEPNMDGVYDAADGMPAVMASVFAAIALTLLERDEEED